MARGQRLPLELIDQVIGQAQHDRCTLKACCAVSREWNSLCHSYIFRKVRIRDGDALIGFERVIECNPVIGTRVREITFGPFTPERSFRASMPWVAAIPRTLPRLLTAVHTIRFERLSDAAEYCDAAFFRLFYNFTSIRRLVLYDSALNLPTLRAFACALRHLEELVILGMTPLMVTVWPAPPLVSHPRFTALTVDFAVAPSTTLHEFIEWFLQCSATHTLTSLDIAVKVLDAKAVNKLLSRIGPQLTHLGLTLQSMFDSDWEFDKIKSEVDIRACTDLRSLTLSKPHVPAMVDFLYQAPFRSLEVVTFRVFVTDDGGPVDPDFLGQLPGLLQSALFNHLRTVRFIQQGSLSLDSVEEVVRGAFPLLYSKGVVVVTLDTESAIPRRQ